MRSRLKVIPEGGRDRSAVELKWEEVSWLSEGAPGRSRSESQREEPRAGPEET